MKLMKLDEILPNVRAARTVVRDATISALYHGCIKGNVSWAKGMTRQDMGSFDKVFRALFPLKWEGDDSAGDKGEYVYNIKKAMEFCQGEEGNDKKPNRGFTQETTWEEFFPVMVAEWERANTKQPKAPEPVQTREEILKGFDKDFNKFLTKIRKEGVSLQELINRLTTVA